MSNKEAGSDPIAPRLSLTLTSRDLGLRILHQSNGHRRQTATGNRATTAAATAATGTSASGDIHYCRSNGVVRRAFVIDENLHKADDVRTHRSGARCAWAQRLSIKDWQSDDRV